MPSELTRRLFGAAVLLLPFSLAAVIFEPLSIESLTRQADVILHGTVLNKTCQRDASGRIYTRIEINVTDVWKGAIAGNPLTIVHGGGVLGDRQAVVSGQVSYDVGEEVVAFLVRNQRGEGVTLGLMQGKFHVWKDTVSGAKFVVSPFHGVPENAAGQIRLLSVSGSRPPTSPLGLAELKKCVQEVHP
jgi:hypothetical protein